jgi:Rrf2 family iron-sulfur cluster assembly transcriptional regulator
VRITTKGRYALRAALALAQLGKNGEMVSVGSLSQAEQISSVFLEQIFFKLKKAGIVRSVRGPGGGFSFDRPLDSFSVHDVLEAAGEELTVLPCDRSLADCDRETDCITHKMLLTVTKVVSDYMKSISIKTLLESDEFRSDSQKEEATH